MKLVDFLGYIPTCLAKIVSDLEILRSDESCGSYYLFLRLDFLFVYLFWVKFKIFNGFLDWMMIN